jgi:ABC-type lipoprotein release transport system permease subunit
VIVVAEWVRFDTRARARSLAFLAVLVAITAATLITATAGARRGASAVDRLVDRTLPATIAVLPNEPGFDWEEVRKIPEVEAMGRFVVGGFEVEGVPADAIDFPYVDPAVMDTIERPVVLEGRVADPARADEAVITAGFEGVSGLGVGDTVTFVLLTPEQVDESYDSPAVPPAAGPRVEVRIVGVVRSGWFGDSDSQPGRIIPSPGLYQAYEANLIGAKATAVVNALIRLEGGAAAIPAFREHLAEVSGRRDIEFFDLAEMAAHASDVADFEADSLLAFALAAGIAAIFLVGQAVTRYTAAVTADLEIMRAFGMTPRERRVAAAVGPCAAAVIGAAIGGVIAVLLSSRFPMGTAEPIEPSPGRQVDLIVLVAGVVGIPLIIAAGSWLVAWSASRRAAGDTELRPSAIAVLAARWGAPISVAVGTRFALERGRGSRAVPVRPALLGSVLGVMGVVGALIFAGGVSDAAANPARFGQVSEIQAYFGFNGSDFAPAGEMLELAAADPDVDAVNDTRQAVGEVGTVDVPVFTLDPIGNPLDIVVTAGRLPDASDEISLATASAAAMGVGVGDEIRLAGTQSSRMLTVTGLAFVPIGAHNDYDSGAWMSRDTYDSLFEGFKFHTADIAVRPGADPEVVAARLGQTATDAFDSPDGVFEVRSVPSRLAELREIRRIPLFLAGFLALLAVGAVGHALATAVRRRRQDIAVLRALGLTGRQSRATVVTQASILAAFGLLAGVPLGVALGRTLWRSVADSTPLDYVPPAGVWVLVLIAPVTILIANLLAAWPSQQAASLRVSHVLRTE